MTNNDWIGLSISIAIHVLVVLLFGFVTIAASEPQTLGYIEVDFGPLSEGRPVRRAVETEPEVTEQRPDRNVDPQPKPPAAPPEEAKPVDLPDQPENIVEEEAVQAPETETISPEEQNNKADITADEPVPEQNAVRPLGGGSEEGTTGASEGDDGPGTDEQKTAPYSIEGLNRSPVFTALPVYAEKVNATIKVRVTVSPQGRIVGQIPLLKANAALEQAVMDALQNWRFNPLPPNAPQVNQTGTITFRFRLE